MANIITIIVTVVGSGGFWAFISMQLQKRHDKKANKDSNQKARDDMLMGIGHDKIYARCKEYIERGSITADEYDNLSYLYNPYRELGGNGTGKKLMSEVENLHFKAKGDDKRWVSKRDQQF